MANLTLAEFTDAITALAEHHGVAELRERFGHMNAFTSRRGVNSPAALAERLHLLTGGLRRQVPATYAFSSLWTDMIGSRLGEEGEKQLEELAERVNACLDGQDAVVEGREADLDQALASYRERLAAVTGDRVAALDMILKAVPAVAARVREAPPGGRDAT